MDHTTRAAPVHVSVTGPTCIDDERLTGRQRAIVAAMAFHGDGGATTEVLVDVVWAGEAPKAARQSLQNQITRLRRRFGADLIRTDHDGYRLDAVTDVQRFEQVVAPRVHLPASPDGVTPLADALAGWRGVPYADLVDFVPAEAERSRLVELHARAQEHLAVCRLAAGDHGRAAVDLAALVGEDPYRERRWTLLVLAHHLAGRQADALAAYDRAVRCFETDLRARPSTALTILRDRIAEDGAVALDEVEAVVARKPAPVVPSTGSSSPAGHRRARAARCRHRHAGSAS
ncbi:MAG: AfsR/SARP family transcriptional regulator [Actinobacteria bacterium]|nr:AfsR/SARP family transcriptional regulator [Actinomycetota bacterium]